MTSRQRHLLALAATLAAGLAAVWAASGRDAPEEPLAPPPAATDPAATDPADSAHVAPLVIGR